MFFDPTYMMLMLPAFFLVMLAQAAVKSSYRKWNRVANTRNISGAQAAQQLMEYGGLYDVALESASGELSDHYDPRTNTLRLSREVGSGRSVSALAIAAHEIGHAMQDHQGYLPLRLRSAIVPAVNIGSRLGYFLIFGGILLASLASGAAGDLGIMLAWLGVAGFGLSALFALATLPVEFNASYRALRLLDESGLIMSARERRGVRSVLTAAAFTYIAALGVALIQMLYFALRVGRLNRR